MKHCLVIICLLFFCCSAHILFAQPNVGDNTRTGVVRQGQLVVPYNSIEEATTLDPRQSSRVMALQWLMEPADKDRGQVFIAQVVLPEDWAKEEILLYIYFPRIPFSLEINGEVIEIEQVGVNTSIQLTSLLKRTDTFTIKLTTGEAKLKDVEQVSHQFLVVARPFLRSENQYFKNFQKHRNFYRPLIWIVGTDIVNHTGQTVRKSDLVREYYTSIYTNKLAAYYDTLNDQNDMVLPGTNYYWGIHHGKGIYDYFWTAETPNLITSAHLQRTSSPHYKAREALSVRVGVRMAEMKKGQLRINNIPLTLRPVAYSHPAVSQAAPDKDSLQAYVIKLKRHNINTIIVSGLPANSDLYDLADTYGLYIIQKAGKWEDTASDPDHWMMQQLSMMFMLCNSPSVVGWQLDTINVDEHSALVQALSDSSHNNRLWGSVGPNLQSPFLMEKPSNLPLTVLAELSAKELKRLKKAYQPVNLWVVDDASQRISIKNGFDFAPLQGFILQWQIYDGFKLLNEGDISNLHVLSGKVETLSLPFNFSDYKNSKYRFRFSLQLASDEAWATKGYEVAWEEFSYRTTGDADNLKLEKIL